MPNLPLHRTREEGDLRFEIAGVKAAIGKALWRIQKSVVIDSILLLARGALATVILYLLSSSSNAIAGRIYRLAKESE
jgi:hypothetical protein